MPVNATGLWNPPMDAPISKLVHKRVARPSAAPLRRTARPPYRTEAKLATAHLNGLFAAAIARYDFIHKAYAHIIGALRPDEIEMLQREGVKYVQLAKGQVPKGYKRPIWNPPFTHRLDLTNPTIAALLYLGRRNRTSVTYVEFARDYIMPTDALALQMQRAYDQHFVQHYQGKHNRMSWANGGSSTGRRKYGSYFTWYCDEPSRLTGELSCFHWEERMKSQKLSAISIKTVNDLAHFNAAERLDSKSQFYAIDRERLGRNHRNQLNGTRDRHSNERGYYNGKSRDWHTGNVLYRANACDNSGVLSAQTFVQLYGKGPYVHALNVSLGGNVAAGDNNFQIQA